MIPLIQREMVPPPAVDNRRRHTRDNRHRRVDTRADSGEFRDLCRIPCRRAGRRGFVDSRWFVLPSFVIITVISYVLRQFESLAAVRYAFFGIRAGVLALLVTALVSMARKLGKNILNIIIALAAFVFTGIFGFDVIPVLIACAVVGLTGSLAASEEGGKEGGREGRRMIYLELFITFFKIGLFTFGGGYAMLPLIEQEVLE